MHRLAARNGGSNDQPLHLFVTCKNGSYKYDNSIDDYARTVCYEQPCTSLTTSAMEVDLKIQRLEIDKQPALLYIQHPVTGVNLIQPLNVVEAIQRIKNAQGNFVYPTQADIDRENEFRFEISILHDLSVSITVNGYEIVNVIPNL